MGGHIIVLYQAISFFIFFSPKLPEGLENVGYDWPIRFDFLSRWYSQSILINNQVTLYLFFFIIILRLQKYVGGV